jgi:hypothetical protein
VRFGFAAVVMASCVLVAAGCIGVGSDADDGRAGSSARSASSELRVQRLPCSAAFGSPRREWFRARYPRWSVRIGPVTFLDARRAARAPLARRGGTKLPVLLEPNRDVTIAIAGEARDAAGFVAHYNGFPPGPGPVPDNAYAALRLEGCPPTPREVRIAPEIDGVFFATFMAIARDACVPLEVTPDRGRVIRRVVSLGAGRCT